MKPVTAWHRGLKVNGQVQYSFNHIEDGHSQIDHPVAHTEMQSRVWKGGFWQRKHCWLDGNNVLKDTNE